ncbi:MAG: iron ABC transporter permease [Planctomycetota bacterium]
MPRGLKFASLNRWTLLSLAACGVVAVPTLGVLGSVFLPGGEEWGHLVETRLPDYVRNSLALVLIVGFSAAVIGTATAWLVTVFDFPGRRVLHVLLLLPLAVPAYLSAYALTDLLQFSGPVQTALREAFGWGRRDYWFPEVRSLGGAATILTFSLYPYVYLAARAAFAEQSSCALEVARTLGRGPWRGFFGLALPMARPSIAAGTALVAMETLADFGAVDHCAVDTFATGVYRTWRSLESPTTAAQLSSVLIGIVALVVTLELLARRRARYFQLVTRRRPVRPHRLGPLPGLAAAAVCAVPVAIGFALPAGIFVHMAFTTGDGRAWEVVRDFGGNTLVLAAAACVITGGLALLVSYAGRLGGGTVNAAAARIASLGYALPGPVVAVGLLIPLTWVDHRLNAVTESAFGWQPGLVLTGSVAALLLGYQTRFLAVALGFVEAGFGRIRPSLDDAARTLGSTRLRMVLRVHLPLLTPSLFAALLLVFVDTAKELPVTLMLHPFNFETLAVRVYHLAGDERLEESAFGALVIIAIGLLPVVVLSRLIDRRRSAEGPAGPPA